MNKIVCEIVDSMKNDVSLVNLFSPAIMSNLYVCKIVGDEILCRV
jgi:formate/nitrite transporter FocA (FNT family)